MVNNLTVVVLAAGGGTRMKSKTMKVLHPIAGRTMIGHVLAAARATEPERIVAVGGGSQSDLWLQIVSDITGVRQLMPERTIGASYGDALLAGLATGVVPSIDAARDSWMRIDRSIEPDPEHRPVYDTGYGIYRSLYESTKEQMHALSALGRHA